MTWGVAIGLATIALTLIFIFVDHRRTIRKVVLPPPTKLCAPLVIPKVKEIVELETRIRQRTEELEELKQRAGTFKGVDLRRASDHLPGTDSAIVQAIELKLAMARQIASEKRT